MATQKVDSELQSTPTENNLPLRSANFSSLADALDYAAQGVTGCNFYTSRGELHTVLPYAELRSQAQTLARRLLGLGLERGSRAAIIADTYPDFHRFFYACQYAGLVPVPLPIAIHLGSHQAYVQQLRALLARCKTTVAMAPKGFLPLLDEAAQNQEMHFMGTAEDFNALPEQQSELQPLGPGELAYLQYTSGSTRSPRGVMITQEAVLSNLAGIIRHGLQVQPGDRCVSWLPYYHDMGLVGFVLGPMACQLSVDYLRTQDFAMRPRQWLSLISKNRASISFSPPFGYELCARHVRKDDQNQLDLSSWRAAGVGAQTIRPDPLNRFTEAVAPFGFDNKAFLACYGMAECSLAVSFTPLQQGLALDWVNWNRLVDDQVAEPWQGDRDQTGLEGCSSIVDCGVPLPGHEVEIRDKQGRPLPDRHCGNIHVKGPSVMSGYFDDPEATRESLTQDNWLNTRDIGYRSGDRVYITGREQDLIIINGRNIWPQDLEYIVEQQPEARPGDALAFAVPGAYGEDQTVVVIQYRERDPAKAENFISRVHKMIRGAVGLDCLIELVPPHTLPRTSSGKLSRSKAREEYLKRTTRQPRSPQPISDSEHARTAVSGGAV